jgi:ElaB/YqjD/DUF883 family membrane-anchored ribosome-binding protein
MNSHKKSHPAAYLSQYAETQVKARVPALAKNAAFVAIAGLASLFALVWLSFTLFTLFNESFGWSRPLSGFATAAIFGLMGAAFLGALKKHQARERAKREIEKDLVRSGVPALSPVHGLKAAIRADASDVVLERTRHASEVVMEKTRHASEVAIEKSREAAIVAREKGEVAMEWVAEHPFRAAAMGAATGWLVGMWTRKAVGPVETI